MGLLRTRADDEVADLDHELQATTSRLRQTPDQDPGRQVLCARIDELLDRRLQLHQDPPIRARGDLPAS
jgi:hypothetical protein